MPIDFNSGILFFQDIQCDVNDFTCTVEEECPTEEIIHNVKEPVKITVKGKIDINALLSLIYGKKITNNWLKMHNGVMRRTWRRR